MAYAEKTKVPVERSRGEIERVLRKAGATRLATFWDDSGTQLACEIEGFPLMFHVRRPGDGTDRQIEQELRRRWRALLLIIKAKLELIESGQSTVEREFLADVMLPDGRTMADAMLPRLRSAVQSGKMPMLTLPGAR